MKQKKLLSVLLAGAMVVSGGSISGLEGIIPEVVAAASSTEWNGQPGVFQVNREAARSTFYSFDTAEKAKAKDRTKSSFYQLLNGDDWKFSWAVKPADVSVQKMPTLIRKIMTTAAGMTLRFRRAGRPM